MSRKKVNRVAIKKRRKNLATVAFVVALLCCVITYKKIDLIAKSNEYTKKLEELEKAKVKEEERTDEIEDYKAYVQSKQFIEQEARNKLGMVYPDEIVYEAAED